MRHQSHGGSFFVRFIMESVFSSNPSYFQKGNLKATAASMVVTFLYIKGCVIEEWSELNTKPKIRFVFSEPLSFPQLKHVGQVIFNSFFLKICY